MKKFFSSHTLVSFLVVVILISSGGGIILYGVSHIIEGNLRSGISYMAAGSFLVTIGFVILHWAHQKGGPPMRDLKNAGLLLIPLVATAACIVFAIREPSVGAVLANVIAFALTVASLLYIRPPKKV